MSKLPSLRRRHDRTANAVVALLDAAWRCRAIGDRSTMRILARDAVALVRRWRSPALVQAELLL